MSYDNGDTRLTDDDFGQRSITPNGFVQRLISFLLEDDKHIERYAEAAIRASLQPAPDGNITVRRFLEECDDTELVVLLDGQPNPQREYLLEALRVMGIRLRRFAGLDPDGFKQFLKVLRESEMNITW